MMDKIEIQWKTDYPVFANPLYLSTLGKRISIYRFSDTNSSWLLPCAERTGPLKIIQLQTLPFNQETGGSANTETEQEIIGQFITSLRHTHDIIAPMPINAITSYAPPNVAAEKFGSVTVNLSLNEDGLWQRLHSKHRNVIRKALSLGVIISTDKKYIPEAYHVYRESQRRSGNHIIPLADYSNLIYSLPDNALQFTAVKDNEVQASALILYSRFSAYYLHGGNMASPVSGSGNLLHWQAMLKMKQLGVAKYDFMGVRLNPEPNSKYAGIRRFKERFGGELTTGFRWEMGLKPRRYYVWKLLKRIKGLL